MKIIKYSGKYLKESRKQLLEKVATVMSVNRFEHVQRVEQTALKLAEKYGADLEKTSIAALLHDYAKEAPDKNMRDIVISENLDLDLLTYGNPVWHGPTGAILAQRTFGIQDEEILQAIAEHTSGARPEDSLVQKIVFVADYIEPQRNFVGVVEARQLADHSIDEAVYYELVHTLKYLLQKEVLIYPKTLQNYNAWVEKRKKEKRKE